MKQLISILLVLSIYFSSNAQNLLIIKGRVLQKSDSVPVFNAHIYTVGKDIIGTTSNKNGEFVFRFTEKEKENNITISSIGFVSKQISFTGVNNKPLVIYLEEDEYLLKGVTITPIEPIQILKNTIANLKTNYPQGKVYKEIYYKEAFAVNGKPIRYLEIVADLVGEGFRIKKQAPYKYDLFIKEKRSGFNNDTTFEGSNGIGVLHFLNGPKRYFKKSNFKNYDIELVGYSLYRNNEVFKLLVKSKENKSTVTSMYITTETFALIAIDQWYESDDKSSIPKHLFRFLKLHEYVDFIQLEDGLWYINSINDFRESINIEGDITEIKRLIRLTKINNEQEFKEKNRITRETDLYTYPIPYNPDFWQNYNVPPETDEEKRVKEELKKE